MHQRQKSRGIPQWLSAPSRADFSLRGWRRKTLFLVVAGLPALLVGSKAAEIVFASVCVEAGTVPALQRALAADPLDSEIYHQLGEARLYDFTDSNPKAALEDLRQATNLAPNRPVYWQDVALASESVNDDPSAQAALLRAITLAPVSPRVHWLAANYDLNAGETVKALPELREVLVLGPSYSQPVYELCLRAGVDPLTVEKSVLPISGEPAFQLEYAAFLVSRGQASAAGRVWGKTVATSRVFPFSLAQPYLDSLMRRKEYSRAYLAWRDLVRLGVIENSHDGDTAEMMFNGGFEHEPLNAGFDWHYDQPAYLRLGFDDTHAAEGRRCLRLDFAVPSNSEYEPIYEDVAVDPGRTYALAALVRSDGITSDSGPRLRVVDLDRPQALDAATAQTVGTTGWHTIQVRFTTGADTHFVQVFVWRPRGLAFPAQIAGTFWLDGVSLKTATPTTSLRM